MYSIAALANVAIATKAPILHPPTPEDVQRNRRFTKDEKHGFSEGRETRATFRLEMLLFNKLLRRTARRGLISAVSLTLPSDGNRYTAVGSTDI